jgi:hypothetical protein
MVSPGKLGSWFLLVIISYTLVSLINGPRRLRVREGGIEPTSAAVVREQQAA